MLTLVKDYTPNPIYITPVHLKDFFHRFLFFLFVIILSFIDCAGSEIINNTEYFSLQF